MPEKLFAEKLTPIELVRQVEGMKWLNAAGAHSFTDHLRAKAKFHAQQAVQGALDTPEHPNKANWSAEDFRLAQRYRIALEVFLELRDSENPFQIITP